MPKDVKEKEPVSSTGTTPTTDVSSEGTTPLEVTPTSSLIPSPEPTGEGQAPYSDQLDDTGVPWKNRFMEQRRKFEDLSQSLPELIEKSVQTALSKSQPTGQPQYTLEQLVEVKHKNPEYAAWADVEIEKLKLRETSKLLDEKINSYRQIEVEQARKQQSEIYVVQSYPDMFQKDNQGRVVGWNYQNPMTREVMTYLQDPRYQNSPDGLEIAADRAFAKLSRSQVIKVSEDNKNLQGQLKKAQQVTMTEGAGKQAPAEKPALNKAMEKLAQTGTLKDAQFAVSEYLKARGFIKE